MLVIVQVPIQIKMKSLNSFTHNKAREKVHVRSNMLKPT